MVNLGTVFRGLRQTTSNKPIAGPADLQGLKLRLPVIPTWIAVWKTLGTDPVPVTLPELYAALKDGRAEASEGDLTQILSFKLAEVQSHLSMTNHLVGVGWVMANEGFMNRLSSSDRAKVTAVMKSACDWATEKMKKSESNLIKQLVDQGMTVGQPDAAAMREKAKPVFEELFKKDWPVTTWEQVLAQ
jgi:TRAP-type C4-dicarboxylate transport system substrate-binding protein